MKVWGHFKAAVSLDSKNFQHGALRKILGTY